MTELPQARYVPALGYQWLTPAYDAVIRCTTRELTFKAALLDQAAIRDGQCLLDVGCGTGTLAIAIKQRWRGASVCGSDGDSRMLAIARAKAEKAGTSIGFDEALSWSMPYESGRFDRVLCSLFFHHLSSSDKRRTLQEIRRVLKPGGELHVADWGAASSLLMRAAFLGVQLLDGFSNTADNARGLLPALAREAGLVDVAETRSFSTLFGTLRLFQAVRNS